MNICDIRAKYDNGEYTVHMDNTLTLLPDNYIFDDELSVRRNKEMVEEHNSRIRELKAAERAKQAELHRQLTEDVVDYIKECYTLNDKQARAVESFVYQEHHSFMCDYFSYIDIFASFADDVVNCCT